MKFTRTSIMNIDNALYGMRNALASWDKSDSHDGIIGPTDMDLAKRLIRAGDPSHRKYLRQIFVSVDITAPLYWQASFCQ